MIDLSTLKLNPKNPRTITDENLEKLCKSIQKFPKMLELRPMVVDENNVVLGGNMRLKALIKLGRKEIPDDWIKKVSDLTEKQKRQFLIKDNIEYGNFEINLLREYYDTFELDEYDIGVEFDVDSDFEEKDLSGVEENGELKECKIEIECKKEEKEELKSFLEKKLKETSLYAKIK